MKKFTTLILLIALIFALSMAACGDNNGKNSVGGGKIVESTPVPDGYLATSSATSATATFGAEQFFLQLTAIANEGQ